MTNNARVSHALHSVATTTLTGTTGNDLLNAPGVVSTEVVGLAGQDTINLALATDTANAGSGNDSITLSRNGAIRSTIFGGDGNDTVRLLSGNTIAATINLGSGDDLFVLTAGNLIGGLVQGAEGSDTISFTATVTNSTVGAGQGADSILFDTGANVVGSEVFGAKGGDTIILRSGAANSGVTLQGSDGHDRIFVTAADTFSGSSFVGGGKGLDSILINGQFIPTVAGGNGNDTIRSVATGFASGVIFGDSNGDTTGTDQDGDDLISTTAGFVGNGSIYGGGGRDTISFLSGAGLFLVDAGKGNDLVGSTALFMTAGGSIYGGAGADTISLGGVSSNTLSAGVFGGDGNDSITLSLPSTAGQVSINGGAGADTITLATSMVLGAVGSVVASATVNGGDGNDSIQLVSTILSGNDLGVGAAAASVTAVSGVLLNYAYGAGDVLAFGTAVGIASTAVNWRTGAPTIFNSTSFSGMVSALATGGGITAAGSIAVYDAGDDLIIAIRGTASFVSYVNVIDGGNLIAGGNGLTTGSFTMNASNFGFSVSGIATNGGFNITFS